MVATSAWLCPLVFSKSSKACLHRGTATSYLPWDAYCITRLCKVLSLAGISYPVIVEVVMPALPCCDGDMAGIESRKVLPIFTNEDYINVLTKVISNISKYLMLSEGALPWSQFFITCNGAQQRPWETDFITLLDSRNKTNYYKL